MTKLAHLKNALQILFLFCTLLCCASCKQDGSSDEQFTITSSTQLLSLAESLASDYRSKSDISITVKGTLGQEEELLSKHLTGLIITTESLKDAFPNGEIVEKVIANDKTVLVTNPGSGINKLTQSQLRKIFFGEIRNWSQVGGRNLAIQIITREAGASIRKSFETSYLKVPPSQAGNLSFSALVVNSNQETRAAITNIKGSIGYLSVGTLGSPIQEIEVVDDQSKQKLEVPLTTIYAAWRADDKSSELAKFVNYLIQSTSARKVVVDEGYLIGD